MGCDGDMLPVCRCESQAIIGSIQGTAGYTLPVVRDRGFIYPNSQCEYIPEGDENIMSDIKVELQGSPSGMPAKAEIVEYLPDIGEVLESILPVDVAPLEAALKAAQIARNESMTGSAAKYIEATRVEEEAKRALHNATALTQDESTLISLTAHKSVIAFLELVTDFDARHGISYAIKGKKSTKARTGGSGSISLPEFLAIDPNVREDHNMTFEDGVIYVTGEVTKRVHRCATIDTLERHMAN